MISQQKVPSNKKGSSTSKGDSPEMKPYDEKMKKAIETLGTEFGSIRAGRANPHVLDRIVVDYYGADTPINQVGNVSVPEPRLLQIQPWDAAMLKAIEKAIQASDLGINPTNDGKSIRLMFPELTEERRKALAKDIKKKGEDAKVSVRNIRREGIEAFKKMKDKGEIPEDRLNDLEADIQALTDKFILEIDKHAEAKTKEIMTL